MDPKSNLPKYIALETGGVWLVVCYSNHQRRGGEQQRNRHDDCSGF